MAEPAPAADPVVATSPLNEVEVESVDELFDRVNDKLIAGVPETITADDIRPLVLRLRAQREKFVHDQNNKEMTKRDRVATGPKGRKAVSVQEALAVDVDDL